MIRVEEVMGTAVSLRADALPTALADAVFEDLRWVDTTFSTYRADSEVRRLDADTLTRPQASTDVREILRRCEELARATGGAFDHMVSGHLDPSALVKGWAGDRAAAILRKAGVRRFSLNVGGDVIVSGGAPVPWRVGVRHPDHGDEVVATLALQDGAVATSGLYERGDHINRPADSGLRSVTVVGPELGLADALSTAIFAGGDLWPDWMAGFPDYAVIGVVDDRLQWSQALDDRLL